MKILKSDLDQAASKGIISSEQANHLWTHLETLRPDQAKFQALHVLYYLGGVLILSSMAWFLTKAWENGLAIMLISGIFAVIYLAVARRLSLKQNFKIPAGLLVTAAVGLTPVFIYGFQRLTGWWVMEAPLAYRDFHVWVKGCWIVMEIGTVITSVIALRLFPFSFLTFPLAFTLWYLSMDLTPIFFGYDGAGNTHDRELVSCIFGLGMIIASYLLDRKDREVDYSFWTYLFGVLAFWSGLSLMHSNSEFNKLIYCLINLILIFASVYLRRRVFIVFGTMGVLGYLSHLADWLFKDSYAFPIVLALLGLGIVFLGVKYQKNKDQFERFVEGLLPNFLLKWRPAERA